MRRRRYPESGFSLIEVTIATGLLAGALVFLAQLLAVATRANTVARRTTFATVLAAQKMEQLRALAWVFDEAGALVSDVTSNTASPDEASSGGTGLNPSPSDSLARDVIGYVDYVDRFGHALGGEQPIPEGTRYTRRWSIARLTDNPDHVLVLQVLVTAHPEADVSGTAGIRRLPGEAWLTAVRTRKAP